MTDSQRKSLLNEGMTAILDDLSAPVMPSEFAAPTAGIRDVGNELFGLSDILSVSPPSITSSDHG